MKNALLLIAVLFLSICTQAQDKLRRGSITFNDGTVKTGLILYKNWDVTPREVKFSESGKETQTYTVAELSSFKIGDEEVTEEYERFTVEIDTSSQDIRADITSAKEAENSKQTLFLQKVVEGKASLYLVKLNANREQFFLRIGNQTALELLNKKFLSAGDVSSPKNSTI